MIQSCTYVVDVKISSSETEINGESVGGQRYRGTKVVLRIARAKERRASNNVQFAKNYAAPEALEAYAEVANQKRYFLFQYFCPILLFVVLIN